jgi:transitional endoplasmic reticulum ATPase
LYQLLFRLPPWNRDVSSFQINKNSKEDLILEQRNKKLLFPKTDVIGFEESICLIIKKALHQDPEMRFQSANEFIDALEERIEIEDVDKLERAKYNESHTSKIKKTTKTGKGFEAIAGMKELKSQMQLDVIDALNNPEEYAKYGVTIPNGMLLYGPPGCGKTFFAKHFAEEVGFNLMIMTPSTLKSRYVNASQENIAKMFEEAEKNAPTIIFIDEINELLPNRDSDAHEMSKSAVNEMLAQMDRTGEKGIFIIGATNYPNQIDPAMLRAGRLDKKFYISPPDFEAREALFSLSLKERPTDFGIDYQKLANMTENYVSADIEFIVNEAARKALKEKSRITMEILLDTIDNTSPSVSLEELKKYEEVLAAIKEITKEDRPKIGFKIK